MRADQVRKLAEGDIIENIRNKKVYEVVENDLEEARIRVKEQGTKSVRGLAAGTIRRNFEKLSSAVADEVVEVKSTEAAKPVAKERPKTVNAPAPKPSAKKSASREKISESAIQQLNDRLQEMITELIPHATKVVTSTYTGYRVKRNFVEISAGKSTLNIVVRPDRLDAQQIEKLTKLYEKNTGWALRAKYRIVTDEDVDFAMQLVLASYKDAEGIYNEADSGKEEE